MLIALGCFACFYLGVWILSLRKVHPENSLGASPHRTPSLFQIAVGFVTNFFDTLGIGSFATTTSIIKFARMIPDELIPGTLNAGHTLPTIFQAFIFVVAIRVDVRTLAVLIGSAILGAWIGAGFVAQLPKRFIRLGVATALFLAVLFMLMRQLNLFPAGGSALELHGSRLIAAAVANGIFAAISTVGIGFYAPCMTLVSLLGMNPIAAFPIMMGSSAFLMPVASSQFVRRQAYSPRFALGLTIGGLMGVPLAAFVVKSLPLDKLRWLVMAVILYAAVSMFRSSWSATPEDPGHVGSHF